MGITNALQIGRSGLLSSQAAIEVAGNNLANATTRGYHRQVINLAPIGDQQISNNAFVGRGQQVQSISRQIDQVLEQRIRDANAGLGEAQVSRDMLLRIESIHNELSDVDLSSALNAFFNAWSELGNAPDEAAQRNLVVQSGQTLADKIKDIRNGLDQLQSQADDEIRQAAQQVDSLLSQIQTVNHQIAQAERGDISSAHSLRDQRDQLLGELSGYMDISVVENGQGMDDVFVGSEPLVLNGVSRGVKLQEDDVDGKKQLKLVLKYNGRDITVDTGKLGGLLTARDEFVGGAIDTLDQFAGSLIHEVNRVHSQGQGAALFDSVTSAYALAGPSAALNSDAAGAAFAAQHGSFQIHVTQKATGVRTTSTINVDLDGIGGPDASLNDIAAAIDAVSGVSATVTADGRLSLAGESGDVAMSFSDDTSGFLAAMGINTFFAGISSLDINVNPVVQRDSQFIAAGQDHVPGDNRNALAIAALRTEGADGKVSLTETWNRHVSQLATDLEQRQLSYETQSTVAANLSAQQQAVSGVNVDEETINLMSYQRSYQASARFLSVVDDILKTLLDLL